MCVHNDDIFGNQRTIWLPPKIQFTFSVSYTIIKRMLFVHMKPFYRGKNVSKSWKKNQTFCVWTTIQVITLESIYPRCTAKMHMFSILYECHFTFHHEFDSVAFVPKRIISRDQIAHKTKIQNGEKKMYIRTDIQLFYWGQQKNCITLSLYVCIFFASSSIPLSLQAIALLNNHNNNSSSTKFLQMCHSNGEQVFARKLFAF